MKISVIPYSLQEEGLGGLQNRFTSPGESEYPTEIFGNPLPFLFCISPWLLLTLRTKPPALAYFNVFSILP